MLVLLSLILVRAYTTGGRRAVPASAVSDELVQRVLEILPNKSRGAVIRQVLIISSLSPSVSLSLFLFSLPLPFSPSLSLSVPLSFAPSLIRPLSMSSHTVHETINDHYSPPPQLQRTALDVDAAVNQLLSSEGDGEELPGPPEELPGMPSFLLRGLGLLHCLSVFNLSITTILTALEPSDLDDALMMQPRSEEMRERYSMSFILFLFW